MRLKAGARLGPYEVSAMLDAGGMGEVYRATDTSLKRQVAIKVLRAAALGDPQRLRRFQREAEAIAALNHPNVATVHGLHEHEGAQALVMELVEGQTLAERLVGGRVPLQEAMALARQIAEGVEAAHRQGIVHRDLKPANIKIRADGLVKVLDFGLAKVLSDGTSVTDTWTDQTATGAIVGTPAYMSPEQAQGVEVDQRADIWAFGCIVFEMLTGTSPFKGRSVADTITAVIAREPEWQALSPDVPASIRHLLRRCLAKDPERRMRDVGEAKAALEEVRIDYHDIEVTRRHGGTVGAEPESAVAPWWRRHALALGATGLLAIAALLATRWAPSDATPQIRSLAVLPFTSLTETPAENYIGLGLADSIITGTSRANALTVRPTSAVRRYLSAPGSALDAGRELNVDAVLEGSWHRQGDQLRVGLNLLRVSDGISLWADSIDVRAGDLLALQDQLAGRIAARLRVEMAPPVPTAGRRGTQNVKAYDLYAQGRFYMGERGYAAADRAKSDAATRLFEQAVQLDPDFAEAHAMLAFAYAWTAVFIEDNADLIARAEAEATIAERLNANLGQVHLTRGFILFSWYRGWRLSEALRENRRALELDPSITDNEAGALSYHLGLLDDWRRIDLRGVELDPNNQPQKRTFVNEFYLVNLPDEGLAMQRQLFGPQEVPDARYFLAKGQVQEAAALVEPAAAQSPNDAITTTNLMRLRALQGRADETRALATRILALPQRNRTYHHFTYFVAQAYARIGDTEDAYRWLEATAENGFPCYPLFASDPALENVRKLPKGQQLLERLRVQWEGWKQERP